MYFLRAHWFTLLVYVALICVVLLLCPIVMRTWSASHIIDKIESIQHADAILILGASIIKGAPSSILQARADAAITLYNEGVGKKILISGDNGEQSYDEVSAVRAYVLKNGISPQDIFLDHAGFDTFSSMYRARYIFGIKKIVVPTQDFHAPRVVFLGNMVGMTATAVVVPRGDSVQLYVREVFASWKALFDILLKRQPKYKGAPIPLIGDGRVTDVR